MPAGNHFAGRVKRLPSVETGEIASPVETIHNYRLCCARRANRIDQVLHTCSGKALFGLATGPATDDAEASVGGGIIGLITGFLAYLVGGYVAGMRAEIARPLNGAMTAIFGLVVGIVLAVIFTVLGVLISLISSGGGPGLVSGVSTIEGVSIVGGGLLAGLIFLVVNILGGYLGGKLSESFGTRTRQTSSRVR